MRRVGGLAIAAKQESPGWLGYLLALAAVGIGFALRLTYVLHASFYIDEFTTIWAGQQVLVSGLPRFPTGALYTQGLLYTYLEAAALALGGTLSPLLARLLSLILATATLALTIYAARRLFGTVPVGLAALWLAVDAQSILWGGRARTYALLQPLVLLAFLAWYHGAVADDRPRSRWLAILLLLAALIDQPLVLLLLPALAVLGIVARGWGWLRRPVVWLQGVGVVLGVGARWALYRLMIPAGGAPSTEPRAFLDLTQPLAGWQDLAAFFADPNRMLPSILLAGGVALALFQPRRGTSSCLPWRLGQGRRSILSIGFVLAFVVLEMLLVAGPTWRDPRYLYPLLPLLFLGAEGVAVSVLRRLAGLPQAVGQVRALRPEKNRHQGMPPSGKAIEPVQAGTDRQPLRRWVLAGLTATLAVMIVALALPSARAAASRDEWGYDRALSRVGEEWVEGDALATFAPLAAFVALGRADYLAVEEGGQVLVVEREGRLVDGWTGLPLLDSSERLSEALRTHSRLWFVVDEMRLNRHFGPDYLRLLWDRFDLVAFERGTFVFRSRPAEPPPAVDRSAPGPVSDELRLESYALSEDRPEPGATVTVTLRWSPGTLQDGAYAAFVHLLDQAGRGIAGHDAPPLNGLYPPTRWPRSSRSLPLPDRHPLVLPANLAPGRYRLEAGLYRSGSLEPVGQRVTLDFLAVGLETGTAPPGPPDARFEDGTALFLRGLEGEFQPGGAAHLNLVWQTGPAGFDHDYTVFIHLLDEDGQIAQQWDAPPARGWVPTSFWRPGEVIADDHDLAFDAQLPPGCYRLIAGLYRADGTRLLLENGADAITLGKIELQP